MGNTALTSGELSKEAVCGPGSGPPCPQALAKLLQETVGELEAAQALVLKRIQIWKRQQQLAGNGAPFDDSMTLLQERLGRADGERSGLGWVPVVSAGGSTAVRNKKPGERALDQAKTQRSQVQQSEVCCCSGHILYKYVCPRRAETGVHPSHAFLFKPLAQRN